MKSLRTYLIAFALLLAAIPAMAVTEKEMEQARTITALCYLRYANNGSGYLDDVKATTMADLEKKLKSKEKENLKAFKAVSVPADYASWDKAKLVKYWSDTFFTSPNLLAQGKAARSRVRSRVGAMSVSAPKEADSQEKTSGHAPLAAADSAGITTMSGPDAQTDATARAMLQKADAEQKADSLAEMESASEAASVKEEGSSSTWIYIVILCILVIAVIWLVVYASNALKHRSEADPDPEYQERAQLADERELERLREKFTNALAAKNDELAQQTERAESLAVEAAESRRMLQSLREENERLQAELDSLRQRREQTPASAPVQASRPERKGVRTIFLGRVNARGIFLRADRNFNPACDVYRLETSDGISGTFYVVDDAILAEMALLDARQMLEGGCMGVNFSNTEGYMRIETVAPGTAVFESGCWKVSRKARIAFA